MWRTPFLHPFYSFFLLLFVLACVLVDAGQTKFPVCKFGVLPRKEWRSLTNDDQQYFLSLLLQVMQRNEQDPHSLSFYDKQAKMHGDGAGPIHGHPVFLPWHRYFLVQLEQEIQSKSVRPISLPYWKWELDAGRPETAPLWSDDTFGKDGDVQTDANGRHCVKTGKFANWKPRSNGEHCLSRWFTGNGAGKPHTLGTYFSAELTNALLTQNTDYISFEVGWELAPHGQVHNSIGGDMVSMVQLFFS